MLRALIVATIAFTATPGIAQELVDTEKLAYCLMAHSGAAEEAAMKNFLRAALDEDVAAIKVGVTDFGAILLKLAINKCGVELNQFDSPEVEKAAGQYGEMLGLKVMQKAISIIEGK